MEDNPTLDMVMDDAPSTGGLLVEKNTEAQKISVLDHVNGFQYTKEKPDSFVIDMESFSHGINKDINNINSNPRITRSLSRKGLQRGSEKKISTNPSVKDREALVATSSPRAKMFAATSSPRGPSTPEKAAVATVGTADHCCSQQVHHQIAITTGNFNATTEGKGFRRNSFKRTAPSWAIDPKRVLFFFATLSSMGTMLLIYLTLSIGKLNTVENSLD